jgi:UDP-glucose 4-epimerase
MAETGMNYNSVLVTGGAGFIGSHLVDDLVSLGHEVRILDDFSNAKTWNIGDQLNRSHLSFVKGDIRNHTVVDDALKGVDAVFHLAAVTSVPFSVKYPKQTFEVNMGGTKNLLEACLRNDVERFIYVSSCAVYGDPKYLPIDEGHPLNPISPYAESKLWAEKVCIKFQESNGLKITVLRPFNVYGPRQRSDQYAGVIASFIKNLVEGSPPLIYGDGQQTRDFIYVEDVVDALILALERDEANGRSFNIATGVPTSINRLASILVELLGAGELLPRYAVARKGDITDSYADIKEASACLGFKPHVPLRKGLSYLLKYKKMVEVVRS